MARDVNALRRAAGFRMARRSSATRLVRPLGALVVACLVLTACGGGAKPGGQAVAGQLDDILKLFRQTSIEDVARGGAGEADDVFRANRSVIDDAFRESEFAVAADDAARSANAQVSSKVAELADRLDAAAQRKMGSKLRSMICEARLYAQNQEGDVEVLRPWITQEFGEIELQLSPYGLDSVAHWLTEKVNDKASTYSLACTVWLRATT